MSSIHQYTGIHEYALALREKRAELIANNMAQSDTPGFRPLDGNFEELLANYQKKTGMAQPLLRLEERGTTAEPFVEKAEYARNAAHYMTSLELLKSQFRTLSVAVKGE